MDMSAIAARLGLSGSRPVVRKAAELRRLCDINFDSSVLGIVSDPRRPLPYLLPLDLSCAHVSDVGFAQGEVCKAIICLEIAATK
jgi:origin recognition complex subunit 6